MSFSEKTLNFLFENRIKNDKLWFEENKSQYQEYVINPLSEFVKELTPAMHLIDNNLICIPKVGKSISRIYRDTRFSKDKSIYRDVMWCVFMRDKKLYNGIPGYFFELSPRGFRYGCGYYQASTQSMESIRNLILNNDKSFQDALAIYEEQETFILESDMYKRSKYPDRSEKLRNWLDRKSISFIHTSEDFNLLFSDKLSEKIAQDFRLIAPLYHFLMKAELQTLTL